MVEAFLKQNLILIYMHIFMYISIFLLLFFLYIFKNKKIILVIS